MPITRILRTVSGDEGTWEDVSGSIATATNPGGLVTYNHHYFPGAARQGFYWWELDVTYYLLKLLSWTGLIWDLNPVPARVLEDGRADRAPGVRRENSSPS